MSIFHLLNSALKKPVVLFYASLFLCINLTACQKKEPPPPPEPVKKIELIQKDLVGFQPTTAVSRTAFTGSIRAVNQSSVQAQVTATATAVQVKIGQKVTQGQILVVLNNQDNAARLAQAQANLASTQAQANLAQSLVQRKKRLFDQGFISKFEYEQSQVDYQAQIENVRAQQANVDIAQKANQDGVIRSPIHGVVTTRQVEPGQTVAVGQTLFEIVDPQSLEIQAKLPIESQQALQLGQTLEYRLQGQTEVFQARLSRIAPMADQVNRQIEFFALPLQSLPSLSIGAFVEGHILASDQLEGQLIPLNSIQNLDQDPFVWVVRQQKLHRVAIQVLQQQYQKNQAIVTGLMPNDLISRIRFTEQDIQKDVVIQP